MTVTNLVQMSVRAGRGVEGGVSETWPSPDLESALVVAPPGALLDIRDNLGWRLTAPCWTSRTICVAALPRDTCRMRA